MNEPRELCPEAEAWVLALSELLGAHRDEVSLLHVAPDIKEKKLRNAVAGYGMPGDEHVIGLIDSTMMGSAKTGLVFGLDGVYFRNSTSSSDEAYTVTYSTLPGCDFDTSKKFEVGLGDVSFETIDEGAVAALFGSVVHLLGAWQEQAEHRDSALSSQGATAHAELVIAGWKDRRDREVVVSEVELEARGALAAAWALRLAVVLEGHPSRSLLETTLWVAPEIPVKKLRTAIGRYKVPDNEVAVGVCGYTGSAKDGILFGLRGIYLRHWEASPSGVHAFSYRQLMSARFDEDGSIVAQLDGVSLSSDGELNQAVIDVVRSVADLASSWWGALDEQIDNFNDEQINIERFEKTAVRHAKDAQTKLEMAVDVVQELGG